MREPANGPRSLTRTSTVRRLSRFSTISHVLKGQGSVRGGHLPHVVHLAAGRPATVERVPVPGRQSGLLVADPSRYWGKNGGGPGGGTPRAEHGRRGPSRPPTPPSGQA